MRAYRIFPSVRLRKRSLQKIQILSKCVLNALTTRGSWLKTGSWFHGDFPDEIYLFRQSIFVLMNEHTKNFSLKKISKTYWINLLPWNKFPPDLQNKKKKTFKITKKLRHSYRACCDHSGCIGEMGRWHSTHWNGRCINSGCIRLMWLTDVLSLLPKSR